MADYESGRQALAELVREESDLARSADGRNEAEARFHIIDRLLIDAIAWPREVIRVEVSACDGYSDYEVGEPPALLVEAKREGIHFTLPAGWSQRVAALPTLFSASTDTEAAVHQALRYCQNRGIPYGAICNGHQLIAFVASRQDGIPPLKGRALVFSSLMEMGAHFRELWDALSPPGVASRYLDSLLRAEVLPPPPMKLSSRILGYPGFKNRNPIATELQILGGVFIEDLARAPELEATFLGEAYCTSGALSQYSLVSRELLRARYSTFFERENRVSASPAVDKRGIAPELMPDILAASLSRRPLLLVGDVGAGKSIFIRHLILVDAKEEFKRSLVLYIDFGTKPVLTSELRAYTAREIERQLELSYGIDIREADFVRGVYYGKIKRFENGIYRDLKNIDYAAYKRKELEYVEQLVADPDEHLRASLEHAVKAQKRQVVLFLDNVDQRPPVFQEEVFLIAQAFAENWPLTAFVSLRPETFAQSRVRGALAAYQPRVFTIDPPRIDLVIVRRLKFAEQQLQAFGKLPWLGFTIHSDNLLAYIRMLLDAFQNQQELVEFVDNMSAGNVRRALEFVAAFVGSGHVDSKKILGILSKGGRYYLPLHEFLRGVVHGDSEHYDPSKSPLMNIFDISTIDGREHFLVSLIVGLVERFGQVGNSEGYADRVRIVASTQEMGFHVVQIRTALVRCLEKGLLGTPAGATEDTGARLRITPAGAYSVKKLAFLFTYIDAVVVDTPIVEPEARDRISDVFSINDRLDRAVLFLDYLDAQWVKLQGNPSQYFAWSTGARQCRDEIAGIKKRLEGRDDS